MRKKVYFSVNNTHAKNKKSCNHLHCHFIFFNPHPRTLFSLLLEKEEGKEEGERKGERYMDVREKHQLIVSYTFSDWGSNPQPRHVPWPGIEPSTFQLKDDAPTNWATLSRAILIFKDEGISSQISDLLKMTPQGVANSKTRWKTGWTPGQKLAPLVVNLFNAPPRRRAKTCPHQQHWSLGSESRLEGWRGAESIHSEASLLKACTRFYTESVDLIVSFVTTTIARAASAELFGWNDELTLMPSWCQITMQRRWPLVAKGHLDGNNPQAKPWCAHRNKAGQYFSMRKDHLTLTCSIHTSLPVFCQGQGRDTHDCAFQCQPCQAPE